MNRITLLLTLVILSLILFGCSSQAKNDPDNELPEALTEVYQAYDQHLQNRVVSSNTILDSFSDALDSIYTGEISENHFFKVLKSDIIVTSQEIVKESESFDVHPSLFDLNTSFINYVNVQHQLFLDAVDMENEEKIQKEQLRKRLVEIKERQANIINTWKQT